MMNSTHELASVLRIIMLRDLVFRERRKMSRGGKLLNFFIKLILKSLSLILKFQFKY